MKKFEIKYEAGALLKTMTSNGTDLLDALSNAGISDPKAFSWSRVSTFREIN